MPRFPRVGPTLVAPGRAPPYKGGPDRRGARVVDWDGLENRCACKRTVGSNPTLSAIMPATNSLRLGRPIASPGFPKLAVQRRQRSARVAVVRATFSRRDLRSVCRSGRRRSDMGDLAPHGLVPFLHWPGFNLDAYPANHRADPIAGRAVALRLAIAPAGIHGLDARAHFSRPCPCTGRSPAAVRSQQVSSRVLCVPLPSRLAPYPRSNDVSGRTFGGAEELVLALDTGVWVNPGIGILFSCSDSAKAGLGNFLGFSTPIRE